MTTLFAAALAAVAALTTQTSNWPIGTEREVDEGMYMRVLAVQDGWRIWRSENHNGVQCKAVKSAVGRAHPVPVGVNNMMFRGTPFLEVYPGFGANTFRYSWTTTHYGDVSIKYRPEGSRFYEEKRNSAFSAEALPEARYDVVLESWEYPAIYVGREEERAVFDFTGRAWAEEQVAACASAASRP